MFSIFKKYNIDLIDYLYMVVMIIYMGQMTPETSRMVGNISGDLFPFLLPIVLTVFIAIKHRVSILNGNFAFILIIFLLWTGFITQKFNLSSNAELSFYFFLFYALIVAYVHVQAFGKKLLPLYEDIVVKLSIISLVLWTYSIFSIQAELYFRRFDPTSFGNNFYYVFNWMDPLKGQFYEGMSRNSGFSWEPGRFSVIAVMALYCNIARNGLKLFDFNVIVLLITIASTLSTTGYVATAVLYLVATMSQMSAKKALILLFILLPTLTIVSRAGFMQKKIEEQMKVETNLKNLEENFNYHSENKEEGEYIASLERFTAMYFEWENVMNDPVFGYGVNTEHSNFYQNVSTNYQLTGGLVKILGQYGIPMGLFIYFLLLVSSRRIRGDYKNCPPWGLFVIILVCSISYMFFTIPVFTAFWMYGIFQRKKPEEKPV